jgi:hypothetical protein
MITILHALEESTAQLYFCNTGAVLQAIAQHLGFRTAKP